jgi:hypothetical protein
MAAVLTILWLALRSLRIIAATPSVIKSNA